VLTTCPELLPGVYIECRLTLLSVVMVAVTLNSALDYPANGLLLEHLFNES